MQGQGDEGCVFQIDAITKPASLHPDADGDTGGFDEAECLDEFVERLDQLFFRQPGCGKQTVLVLEKFRERKRGA